MLVSIVLGIVYLVLFVREGARLFSPYHFLWIVPAEFITWILIYLALRGY